MAQLHIHTQSDQSVTSRFKPTLVKSKSDDQSEVYLAALTLVQYIDESLTKGTQHYRTKSGHLLGTLDEVVRAILADNLIWETEGVTWEEDLARAA